MLNIQWFVKQDFWKSRRFIKSVEGFDHSSINSVFGACGELPLPHEVPILPYAVWQCGQYEVRRFSLVYFEILLSRFRACVYDEVSWGVEHEETKIESFVRESRQLLWPVKSIGIFLLYRIVTQSFDSQELTDVFTVMEFDFSHPIQTMEGVTEVWSCLFSHVTCVS